MGFADLLSVSASFRQIKLRRCRLLPGRLCGGHLWDFTDNEKELIYIWWKLSMVRVYVWTSLSSHTLLFISTVISFYLLNTLSTYAPPAPLSVHIFLKRVFFFYFLFFQFSLVLFFSFLSRFFYSFLSSVLLSFSVSFYLFSLCKFDLVSRISNCMSSVYFLYHVNVIIQHSQLETDRMAK